MGGWGKCCIFVADLPSKKLSLQKIFGSNLLLHGRVASGNPFPHYAELRSARKIFPKKDLGLIAEPEEGFEPRPTEYSHSGRPRPLALLVFWGKYANIEKL
jgi:hypothetical protein